MRKADQPLVDEIIKALDENPKAVCRAIILLGNAQTTEELNNGVTLKHNNVGFTATDARFGTWAYNVLKNGGTLHGKALISARTIAKKYARTQLLEAAKRKQAAIAYKNSSSGK